MGRRVLVRNPASGDQKRSEQAVELARDRGYEVRDTSEKGEDITIAREVAADGAEMVVACGGDGTLNGVVRGVHDAGKLGEVTLGVVPAGTGNDFADNVGIRDVAHAFDVLEEGETRRLDVGMVEPPRGHRNSAAGRETNPDDAVPRPFVNSCVCGLTAEASARTEPSMKKRLGTLAYVLTTLQTTRDFEGLELDVRAGPERNPVWSGDAVVLLAGNARHFPGRQANMEDGNLDIVIIERAPAIDYLTNGAATRLLKQGASYLTRLAVPSLSVTATEPRQFSLDGEMIERRALDLRIRERAMPFKVGGEYEPNPAFEGDGENSE